MSGGHGADWTQRQKRNRSTPEGKEINRLACARWRERHRDYYNAYARVFQYPKRKKRPRNGYIGRKYYLKLRQEWLHNHPRGCKREKEGAP